MAKIILFTHQKGGVGKSTLSYNVANLLNQHAKVGLIDWDYQGTLLQVKELNDQLTYIDVNRDVKKIPQADFDFIIIDTPPYIFEEINALVKLADLIVVPTQASINDLLAIDKTVQIIKENDAIDRSVIVFNRIKSNSSLKDKLTENFNELNVPIANTIINDYDAITNSIITKGVESRHKASGQLQNLTTELMTKLLSNG
jgi:chromosome partitioning protein